MAFTLCSGVRGEPGRPRGEFGEEHRRRLSEALRGYWEAERAAPSGRASLRDRPKRCRLCGEEGHNALHCPNAPEEVRELLAEQRAAWREARRHSMKGRPRRCSICGEVGHYAPRCPHAAAARIAEAARAAQAGDQDSEAPGEPGPSGGGMGGRLGARAAPSRASQVRSGDPPSAPAPGEGRAPGQPVPRRPGGGPGRGFGREGEEGIFTKDDLQRPLGGGGAEGGHPTASSRLRPGLLLGGEGV